MLSAAFSASAQVFDFADDAVQRGYYDRPWQRYEAEPGFVLHQANFFFHRSLSARNPFRPRRRILRLQHSVRPGTMLPGLSTGPDAG